MPKMKTKRCAVKRFKKTGSGKIVHFGSNARHMLIRRSKKQKRHYRKKVVLSKAMFKRTNIMITA